MEKTILMTALLILSFAYGKAQTGNIPVNVYGTLDNNINGIPIEPVGASNMTSLGRPSFKKCKFQLNSESKEMTLTFVL